MTRKATRAEREVIEASIDKYGASCWTPLIKRQKYRIRIENPKKKAKWRKKMMRQAKVIEGLGRMPR
jgi:hypothetical protein